MTVFKSGGGLDPEADRNIIIERPELDRVFAHIKTEDLYVALRSPRQTGKTTLLFQLQSRLQESGYGAAYIDLGGLSEAAFYETLCTEIQSQFDKLIRDNAGSPLPPQTIKDQEAFLNYLTWFSAHTPQALKLILMLDEVGAVPEKISPTFFSSLRRFFHSGRRPSKKRHLYQKVMFIFAGALELRLLMHGKASPLRNICEPFSLDDFSREQGLRLASRLGGFCPAGQEVIAEAVHKWCGGHPYLTLRLYALIDASQEDRRVSVNQLPEVVDRLVAKHILYDSDANLSHILDQLEKSPEYQKRVVTILRSGKRKSVWSADDLLSIGIIKRSEDLHLVIRNKIYEKVLNDLFEVEEA